MVCELKAGANREGFAVLEMTVSQQQWRIELRGEQVWLHDQHATYFLDGRQALHRLLRQLMLAQTQGDPL